MASAIKSLRGLPNSDETGGRAGCRTSIGAASTPAVARRRLTRQWAISITIHSTLPSMNHPTAASAKSVALSLGAVIDAVMSLKALKQITTGSVRAAQRSRALRSSARQ